MSKDEKARVFKEFELYRMNLKWKYLKQLTIQGRLHHSKRNHCK